LRRSTVRESQALTPKGDKSRFFPMGGFSANKLRIQDDGKLSDDGASYDLDELSEQEKAITDDDVLDMLASKHRFVDN
jgi:hypothetical protein